MGRPCNWRLLIQVLSQWHDPTPSGRMSKDFLEKMDVNSFRYSGIGGEVALELALEALARH